MATLLDNPTGSYNWTDNEVYEMQQTDGCEGAASGASFDGLGVNNQPHQQLAERTRWLKGRQDTNIASIDALQAVIAGLTSVLNLSALASGGESMFKIPVVDQNLGAIEIIVLIGYFALSDERIEFDTQFEVNFVNPFPHALLAPPMLTNVYFSTSGGNTVASVVAGTLAKTGFAVVFDVIGSLGPSNERTNGCSYIAFGY